MQPQLLSSRTSAALLSQRHDIAAALVDREFDRHPQLEERYGKIAREKSQQDAVYHLSFLAQALGVENPALFVDYVAWAKVVLNRRKIDTEDLVFHLNCLAETLREHLPTEEAQLAVEFVESAVAAIPQMPEDLPSFLQPGAPLSPLAHQYFGALLRGERQLASRLVLDAVANGLSVKEIYLHVFQPAQYEIGRLWQTNQMTVAQEHYCTAATQLIMSQLYPQIFSSTKIGKTLVATCVAGDLHEIGVRMVADFFEMEGWDTYYLGGNMPHADVVTTITEKQPDLLAISATISYHIDSVRDLILAVRRHPATRNVRILVGGHPFNRDPELWRVVGADATACSAQEAIHWASQIQAKKL